MNRRMFLAGIILPVLLSLLTAQAGFAQTTPRKFYKYDVIESTSPSLEVFAAPSINDFGDVAFAGRRTPGGGTVFLSEIGQPNVDLMPGSGMSPNQFVAGRVQINDFKQVIQHTFISGTTPPQNVLRRIDGVDNFTLIAYANGAGPFNDFDQIYGSSIGLNNNGDPVYVTRTGSNTTNLTTGIRPDFSTLQFPSTGDSLQPMISDLGCVVVRTGASPLDGIRLFSPDLQTSELIASNIDGFTALGQSPGISNFCEVIVFYGDLNAAGAEALGTNPGPGIFASIETDKIKKERKIVRLAGRFIEDISAPGGNDDGYCDPGETCVPGELGFTTGGIPIVFNSFDSLNRVAVAHQSVGAPGIEDDIFVVSFLGTPNVASDRPERPFSNQLGLWTQTTQIKNLAGTLRERPAVAVPVIQIGDVVNSRTITSVNIYDQLASVRTPGSPAESPGGHRLAFHVTTNNGNMIIRASRKVEVPVIFIPGVGGSILAECNDTNCSSFTERWPASLIASNYPSLSLAPGEAREIEALGPVESVLGRDFYGNLLAAMTTGAGGLHEYQVERPEQRTFEECDLTQQTAQPNLFVFAYDWRKSIFENAVKLRSYVRCIQRFYPETKVDILAHSMGGLVARSYILNFEDIHDVRKVVTIGSPFVGAPRSLKVLETGGFFEPQVNVISSAITAVRARRITSANRIFKQLLPHFKGAHELMPSEPYFQLGGNPFAERFDFNGDGVISANGYNYDITRNTFNSRFGTLPYETNRLFHTLAQDDWRNDTSGVEYYQLFGKQVEKETPETIVARRRLLTLRQSGRIGAAFDVVKGFGDGTVPVLSAQRIGNGIDLNADIPPEPFEPMAGIGETDEHVSHNGLTANGRVQDRIFEILGITSQSVVGSASHQGKEENVSENIGGNPQRESNYLMIEGDVETVQITDELGRTNIGINDDFEFAVPEVNYEPVFVGEPETGWYVHNLGLTTLHQYTIKFRTGTDPINVVNIELVRGFGNSSPSYAVRYLDPVLPPNVECLLTITAEGMEDLRYDSDGNGTYDVVVPAHVRVTGTAAQDVTAPDVSINITTGLGGTKVATINAVDAQSGVGTVYYRLNEFGNFQIYTGPFALGQLVTVVEAFADDNVGNRSSPIREVVPRK